MGTQPRKSNPTYPSSSNFVRCIPLLLFLFAFAFLFYFNIDTFVHHTKSIALNTVTEQSRLLMNAEGGTLHTEQSRPLMNAEGGTLHTEKSRPLMNAEGGALHRAIDITWGEGHAKFHNNGSLLTLSLDKYSGAGFRSKNEYLFGKIEIQIKLIAGNSAGTVTTYYFSSEGENHDEIDFEFLGNSSGDPYTLHTNVYCQGKGNREQQFYLWFDPTLDFHTYTINWNPKRILFFVDGTPIREFKNMGSNGIPFPHNQRMRVYSSLWNADDWATQGGRVKTDWTKEPFIASYRNYKAAACVMSDGVSSCGSKFSGLNLTDNSWVTEKLNTTGLKRLKWVQKNHMVYNYCVDKMRFQEGLPPECKMSS